MNGLVVAGDGAIQIAQFFQRIAKVVMRLGVIGLNGQRLAKAGDRVLWPPQVYKRRAEVAMRLG